MNEFQLYFELGLEHILNIGAMDHILFLLALVLIFSLKEWKKLFWLVSLFTLAHTSSLLLSVYGVLELNENLIEKTILITILITALSNILIKNQKILHQTHFYFSFFFGLVHGLGFAKDFKMIIVGQHHKLMPLLEFALGIEIAQIILGIGILSLSLIVVKLLKVTQKEFISILSAMVVGYVLSML